MVILYLVLHALAAALLNVFIRQCTMQPFAIFGWFAAARINSLSGQATAQFIGRSGRSGQHGGN